MKQLRLDLKSKKLAGEISISGSKSISNRVLVMNALARANTSFPNLSTAHDTLLMSRILEQVEICSKVVPEG